MATRWYFGNDSTTKALGDNVWNLFTYNNGETYKYEARTTSQNPTTNSLELSIIDSDADVVNRGIAYFVTQPLSAQTLNNGSTFRLQICCRENNAAANDYLRFSVSQFNSNDQYIRVFNGTSSTEFVATSTASNAANRT